MPELPEIETLASELRSFLIAKKLSRIVICHDNILGTPREILEQRLPGGKVSSVLRDGKYLRIVFHKVGRAETLWFHLGMTGQLLLRSSWPEDDRHLHLILEFYGTKRCLLFRDVRKFGKVFFTAPDIDQLPEGLRRLGPDPFEVMAEEFASLLGKRKGRIKNLLLNQRLISGIGNIYADESLHRAGIDPRNRPYRMAKTRLMGLHRALCEVLEEAIRAGGSSIDDYRRLDGSYGRFQRFHRVYGRFGDRCMSCGTPIRRIRLSGRSSCFCPVCQR